MALSKVEICGVNTAKLPLLSNEEKEALFVKIKEGDEAARERYIKGNLRLVLSVIKRFASSNENVDDLFQIVSSCLDVFHLQFMQIHRCANSLFVLPT